MTIPKPEIIAFGDNVVDCYADHDRMFPGGNALNHAVFAQRFGARASYHGAVADDAAGRHIRASLVAEGVDVSGLRSLPGRTAFCVIGNRDGEREFLRADLGVSIIAPRADDLVRIAGADAVHTGRSSHVDGHLADFADRARLSYDFATVRTFEMIASIAPLCYLASFSGGDLDAQSGLSLARAARQSGAIWCLITRGEAGAVLVGPESTTEAPAAPTQVVDTLGAGDTFIARTLVGLLRGEAPGAILAAAAQAAAQTCGHLGGFGHPAPTEIDESHAMTIDEIYAAPPVVHP
ncbi:PfkB family carbohydrate kinase [Flavimaricola marinus]|uniref:Fructosamine kinase FrlD n=1 Tax=Flavimaricola marinus TaxID=1819565 RepID=A0A238LKA3_9RHOB|nr:PfkB family carbohydrate kinase [Flavimaricola marinus]SMY09824.1 Fructosamine kinase FrlD [Flavimaricola marinus]